MKLLVALSCVAALAAAQDTVTLNTYQGADQGHWYDSPSSWDQGHFPRTGENARVVDKDVVFVQSEEPAHYEGASINTSQAHALFTVHCDSGVGVVII